MLRPLEQNLVGQHRSTQRRRPRGREDEDRLVADMIELVRQYGRYGYRRITALLRDAGWQVNDKRIERLWRREGLKVPMKQPKKGRLWLNDGSCIRLRPEYRDHVWSYDFVHHRTDDGKVFRALNILEWCQWRRIRIRLPGICPGTQQGSQIAPRPTINRPEKRNEPRRYFSGIEGHRN